MFIAKINEHYLATKCGKILSLRFRKVKVLKPHAHPKGHLMVALHHGGGAQKTQKVHHLVLEAFGFHREEGQVCRHLNGDPSDNRLENLRWGTMQENADDDRRLGVYRGRPSQFTEEQIEEMKMMPGSQTEVARKFGVTPGYISLLRSGKRGV